MTLTQYLYDLLYYALPIIAGVLICKRLAPKFGNDFRMMKINPIYLLVCVIVFALCFALNALIWVTAAFFVLRGSL
jgi:hypothetical protein